MRKILVVLLDIWVTFEIILAPEVMCRSNHGVAADYFALGVIVYECMMGKVFYLSIQRPYVGHNRREIRDQILSKQIQLVDSDIPRSWSTSVISFVNKMLKRKPQERLGAIGPSEINSHPCLCSVDWKALFDKRVKAPFVPNVTFN